MTDHCNDWRSGEWGVGVVAIDADNHVDGVVVVCQPATATWEQQRDLSWELKAGFVKRGWMEVFWVTPGGRLFFLEPHDEKDLDAVGAAVAPLLAPIRFDQSALLDESVERRRRQGRYEPQPVVDLPLYWWWLADPATDKVVLGPDPGAPSAWRETPTEARQRLHLLSAPAGFIYPLLPSEHAPRGGWRITTDDHDPVADEALKQRLVDAVKRHEAELLSHGAHPRLGRS